MTIWVKKFLLPSFPTSEEVHSVDTEVEERVGGSGVFELSVVQAVTVFTFKREKIKDRKFKSRRAGLRVSPLFGRHPGICSVNWCWAPSRDSFPSLFPLVLSKLNGLFFKYAVLSKTPLKLSFPFFPPLQLLSSSHKYYVSFWLKLYIVFRERLVRSNPREAQKGKRRWLAFLQRCGTESWTEVRCYFSMRCVLFPQCFFVWPTRSNKTLEEIPSSCFINDCAPQFHLWPTLTCKIIMSRSG